MKEKEEGRHLHAIHLVPEAVLGAHRSRKLAGGAALRNPAGAGQQRVGSTFSWLLAAMSLRP